MVIDGYRVSSFSCTQYRVENDLGDEENWKCQQQSHFVVTNVS